MEEYQNYMNVKGSGKKGNFVRPESLNDFNGNQEENHNLPHIPHGNEETPTNNNSYKSVENNYQNHYNSVDPNVENYNNHMYGNPQYESNSNANPNSNPNINNYNPSPYPDNNANTNNNNYIPNVNNNNYIPSNNYSSNNQSNTNNQNQNENNSFHNPQLTLTDYNTSMKNRKHEQQQAYKNYLDSQVSNRSNRSQSSASRVIPQKKNNEPKANPFSNKNYEFGSSNLGHNPILNPTNNYGYNKYITSNNGSNNGPKLTDKFQRAANNILG